MYPQHTIWHPVIAIGALVAAAILATSTVVIEPGETLSRIAARNDVTVAELVAWNDIDDPDRIFAGTTLIVSAPDSSATSNNGTHFVTAGETLSVIAQRFGTTVGRLVATNDLVDADLIVVGQELDLREETTNDPTEIISPALLHVVAPGDTLGTIAALYDMKIGVLARDNDITDVDRIVIGTTLTIRAADSADDDSPAAVTTTVAAPEPTPPARNGDILLSPIFESWSNVYNVPQGLLEAIAWNESKWRSDMVGPNGHLGITQLSPDTVSLIEGGLIGRELNPLYAEDGIQMAARYLRYLLDHTQSEREATAAWVQGLSTVQRDGVTTTGGEYADAVEAIRQQRD